MNIKSLILNGFDWLSKLLKNQFKKVLYLFCNYKKLNLIVLIILSKLSIYCKFDYAYALTININYRVTKNN